MTISSTPTHRAIRHRVYHRKATTTVASAEHPIAGPRACQPISLAPKFVLMGVGAQSAMSICVSFEAPSPGDILQSGYERFQEIQKKERGPQKHRPQEDWPSLYTLGQDIIAQGRASNRSMRDVDMGMTAADMPLKMTFAGFQAATCGLRNVTRQCDALCSDCERFSP